LPDGHFDSHNRVREQSNFVSRFKLIWLVQSFAQKYSAFVFAEIMI